MRLFNIALRAATDAVNEMQPSDRAMYTGDIMDDAIYTVEGLAEMVLDAFYEDHPEQEQAAERKVYRIMKELADDMKY